MESWCEKLCEKNIIKPDKLTHSSISLNDQETDFKNKKNAGNSLNDTVSLSKVLINYQKM